MSRDLETRERLVRAAESLFAERGFRRVTVREICVTARANVAAVNYHFGDKLGLYRVIVQRAIDRMCETTELARRAGDGQPPEEQLRRFISIFLQRLLGPGHNAVHQLMDREWPEEERESFLAAAAEYPELSGLHDLRTRTSGAHRFVQFHVWVPADWTVLDAHRRMDAVEEKLQHRFPGCEIIIHLDPEGHIDREGILPQHLTESAR